MVFDLYNKIALVTGSTGKVTRHLCLGLARAGADLALQYHQKRDQAEELKNTVENLGRRCKIYVFDLTDPSSPSDLARQVLADFGGVDILVNTASAFVFKDLAGTDDALWQRMFDLHVTATFRLVRALEENFSGRESAILNFADIWGLTPKGSFLAYSVSKAALIALTKALADALAPATTVNAIAPGIAHFPPDVPPAFQETVLNRIPLRRTARPEEIADFALEILRNRYLTGQTLVIDGGRSLT